MATAKKQDVFSYKGHPLLRKDNTIYYGSMADSHIVMLQILDTDDTQNPPLARKVSVQLQKTADNVRPKERIVKTAEKDSLWSAMDIASIWLGRALSAK